MCEFRKGRSARTHFGTISLKSSIFSLPAGVSPILTSMKTIGRWGEDIVVVKRGILGLKGTARR
jgi:hypothetical protein